MKDSRRFNVKGKSNCSQKNKRTFAGYKVIQLGGNETSIENDYQIQKIALLLNEYEHMK